LHCKLVGLHGELNGLHGELEISDGLYGELVGLLEIIDRLHDLITELISGGRSAT